MRLPPLPNSVSRSSLPTVQDHSPTVRYGVAASPSSPPLPGTTAGIATTLLQQMSRNLSGGAIYPDEWSTAKRCRHLRRLKKRLAQTMPPADSTAEGLLTFCRHQVTKNLLFERLSTGDIQLREMLRIALINSIKEACWINRRIRQQHSGFVLNVWQRTDRLRFIREIVDSRTAPFSESQTRVLQSIVRLLERRKTGRWRDIREDVDICTRSLLRAVHRPSSSYRSFADQRGTNTVENERGGMKYGASGSASAFRFPRVDTGQRPESRDDRASSTEAGFRRYADMASYTDGHPPFSESVIRSFNRKVILFIKGTFGLQDEQVIDLSGFLQTLSPCIDTSGALSRQQIHRRVSQALERYPEIVHHFRCSCQISREAVKASFAELIARFNVHLARCAAV